MRLLIGGTRGSVATTASDRAHFGGDTTSLLLTGSGGEVIVLDCGTGLPALATRLGPAPDVLVLLSHFHLDHLVGLPAFAPLYERGASLRFAAAAAGGVTVATALRGLLGAPYWPVELDQLPASLRFDDLAPHCGADVLRWGGLEVRWTPLPHPGGCTAFRIDEPQTSSSLVVSTDAEWDDAPAAMLTAFVDLCRHPTPCGLLICDGQYDADTIADRRGWGHTTWVRAAGLAREVGARRMLVTHHDPEHDDQTLHARERALQVDLPTAALARQGQQIDLARLDQA